MAARTEAAAFTSSSTEQKSGLLPLVCQLSSILRRLRILERQTGYSPRDISLLQDELRKIEEKRRPDGTFSGQSSFERTGELEAIISSLLHKSHRLASSLVGAGACDPSFDSVLHELEDIQVKLEDLARIPNVHATDSRLHDLQSRLHAAEAKILRAAEQPEPVAGQAFVRNLLEQCYHLVSRLQLYHRQEQAPEIDPSLTNLHKQLCEQVKQLDDARDRRALLTEKERSAIRSALIDAEKLRVDGVFLAEGKKTQAPIPAGQAALSSLLNRAYHLLREQELAAAGNGGASVN